MERIIDVAGTFVNISTPTSPVVYELQAGDIFTICGNLMLQYGESKIFREVEAVELPYTDLFVVGYRYTGRSFVADEINEYINNWVENNE